VKHKVKDYKGNYIDGLTQWANGMKTCEKSFTIRGVEETARNAARDT